MRNERVGHGQGIGAVLTGEVATGCFTGPVVRLAKPPARPQVAGGHEPASGSGGRVAPIVAAMTKPTKQSAYKQLQDRAEELRKAGHTAPWVSAMVERPDLALIAEGREPAPAPLKASASPPTAKDAAGARLVQLVGELSAKSGRTRSDCWMQVIRENPELSSIASRR